METRKDDFPGASVLQDDLEDGVKVHVNIEGVVQFVGAVLKKTI